MKTYTFNIFEPGDKVREKSSGKILAVKSSGSIIRKDDGTWTIFYTLLDPDYSFVTFYREDDPREPKLKLFEPAAKEDPQ